MSARGQNDDVRRDILAAIRSHLAASAPFDAVHAEHHKRHDGEARAAHSPAVVADEQTATPLERFHDALTAVGGHCTIVHDDREAAEVLRRIIEQRQARRVAVSDAPLVRQVIGQLKWDAVQFAQVDAPALFECDLGVTAAQWAVAETGTLVLESDRERHRLASLVPPVHVALVEAGQIRQTLGEVLQEIGKGGQAGLSRAITFITGPSRTSDIELTLAIGVHGPGELHVVIIAGADYDRGNLTPRH